MKALILAAGRGTRLLPHTEKLPKCLTDVRGKSILERQLEALAACGVHDVIVVIGHLGEQVEAHLRERYPSVTFVRNPDYATTNSVHSLWLARDLVSDDPEGFLVLNGDLIFTPAMVQKLLHADVECGIVIERPASESNDMVDVKLEDGRILYMGRDVPKEDISAEAVGPIKFSQKSGIEYLKTLEGRSAEWVFYLLSEFAQTHSVHGVWTDGEVWQEIDTIEDLEKAQKIFIDQS